MCEHVLHRAGYDHLAAVHAGTRADIDNMVSIADRVLIVLDHQDGIAQIAEVNERAQQALVIPLMEAD